MKIITNGEKKVSFIGIALSGVGTIESAAAVLDENAEIIFLDKLFSMNDVKYFCNTFAGKRNAITEVSIPYNETMLSTKWKYNSRTYDAVNFEGKMMNRDGWADRFSTRGSDYFKELSETGVDVFRYYTDNIREYLAPQGAFKDRTPADCKFLRDILVTKYNMRALPSNMLPVAQLEAICGALTARKIVFGNENSELSVIGDFEGLPVTGYKFTGAQADI